MSYYADNPQERDEAPRCLYCDAPKQAVRSKISGQELWKCTNVNCEDCAHEFLVRWTCKVCGFSNLPDENECWMCVNVGVPRHE